MKPERRKAGGKRQVRKDRTGALRTGKVPAGELKRLRILERLEAQASFNASNARLAPSSVRERLAFAVVKTFTIEDGEASDMPLLTRNVAAGATVVGNPARRISKRG